MSAGNAVTLTALLGGHRRPEGEGARLADPDESQDAEAAEAAQSIVEIGQRLDRHGWVQATAGNLSMRLPDGRIAITRSGCHKGFLTTDDVMLVDLEGEAVSVGRPSAETLLHCQIYGNQPRAGAVLHGHSVAATVLTLHRAGPIVLSDYEVLKAFEGQRSHQARIELPVFDNDQDIARLAREILPHFAKGMPAGYAIRGHGVYAWGPDMATALARLEALEFLFQCELEAMRLR